MNIPRPKPRCSHCGRLSTEAKHFFSSTVGESNAHICDACLLTYYALYVDHLHDLERMEEDRYQIADRLATALQSFVAHQQNEYIVAGGSQAEHRPEVAVFRRDHLTAEQIRTFLDGASLEEISSGPVPDLVAHVAEFLQWSGNAIDKTPDDVARGVPLVWIIRPHARHVEVWHQGAQGAVPSRHVLALTHALDGLNVLPGFRYTLSDLFENIW